MDYGMLAIDYDFSWGGDHEGRHHGRRLLALHWRRETRGQRAIGGDVGEQLAGHGVYGRGFGCLGGMRRGGRARLKRGCGWQHSQRWCTTRVCRCSACSRGGSAHSPAVLLFLRRIEPLAAMSRVSGSGGESVCVWSRGRRRQEVVRCLRWGTNLRPRSGYDMMAH